MPFIPTEDGCRLILNTLVNGSLIGTNHFWFRKADFVSADLVTLAEEFRHFFYTNNGVKDYISQTVDWTMKLVDERSYDGEIYLRDGSDDGEDITELYSVDDALVVTLYTGKRGRAYRGRLYFFGFCEDGLTDGVFNAAAIAALNTSIEAMKVATIGGGWTWCVRTSQIDKVPQNPCFLTPVSSYIVRSGIPAGQKRRGQRP